MMIRNNQLINRPVIAVAVALLVSFRAHGDATRGELHLTITDTTTAQPTAARVEIRGADGNYYVAQDAVPFGGDCRMSAPGAGLLDDAATVQPFGGRRAIVNPYTKSLQFYAAGSVTTALPLGPATVKVMKGPEFKVATATVEIESTTTALTVDLERWANMPAKGWYSGDDHLHIARPTPEQNATVSKMLQAEDVHVANLLQMGKVGDFAIAEQYAHGPASYYQEGNYILAAGQENPRTHFLGHTITLGAEKTHYNADQYLIYRLIWEETVKEGALNGFAHAVFPYGSFIAPHDGMAVVLPHQLMHFLEVLQFDRTGYDVWYDLLALGLRITPTAGTDYPCGGQILPGHERFYTRVDGAFTYKAWLESVRHGRTFVTTGPLLDFRVNGQDIGSELTLDDSAAVEITGGVSFDPKRDDVNFVELLQNGHVIERFSRTEGRQQIDFRVERSVAESSWFAIRGYGNRLDELPFADPLIFGTFEPNTTFHSAPIYVTLRGRPPIEQGSRAKEVAGEFYARLNDLERVLVDTNLDYLAAKLEAPTIDAVPKAILRKNRDALLSEIEEAKTYFKKLMR